MTFKYYLPIFTFLLFGSFANAQITNVFECSNQDTLWFSQNLVKFPAIQQDYKTYIVTLDSEYNIAEVKLDDYDCGTSINYWDSTLRDWRFLMLSTKDSIIYEVRTQTPTKYIMVRTTSKTDIFAEFGFIK